MTTMIFTVSHPPLISLMLQSPLTLVSVAPSLLRVMVGQV